MKIAFWLILLIILELPLIPKYIKHKNNYNFSAQIAVIVLMIITAFLVYGIYSLANYFLLIKPSL